MKTRLEKDPLGEMAVPAEALYGIQTLRAVENYPISGLRPLPAFVDAVIRIKKAAALTHRETGRLEPRLADAIASAASTKCSPASTAISSSWTSYQAGAGTSHHMNCNEVLANRANELLGAARGSYAPVHPNDHVNMAQSTNDVIPTAMRLATLATLPPLLEALDLLADALPRQGTGVRPRHQVGPHPPAGRDADPPGPGVRGLRAHRRAAPGQAGRGRRAGCEAMNIGGTAVGTGLNAEPGYPALMVKHLREITRARSRGRRRPDSADAVDGRHRHLQRRAPRLRCSTSTSWPTTSGSWPPAPGPASRRSWTAGGAAGLQHHAGQGQSVHRRDGQPGLLPGAGAATPPSRWRPRRASSSST